MKYSIFASFTLFSFLLFASTSYARKEPGDYWKSIMKDKPMPKAIKELFHEDGNKIYLFVKDFDLKSSAIIYHHHSEPVEKQEEDKSIKPEKLKISTYTHKLKD